jgi:hypothetical protein
MKVDPMRTVCDAMRPSVIRIVAVVVLAAACSTAITVTPAAAADIATFHGQTPQRLLDTRPGQSTVDGQFAGSGPLGAGATMNLTVTGRGSVPASGVGSVALNVTVTGPTNIGYTTVFPAGAARPTASNLNFVGGQTVANMVSVSVGEAGQVSLFNSAGNTHVVVDVLGWYPPGSAFNGLNPARLLDTRPEHVTIDGQGAGGGPVAAGAVINVTVLSRGGVATSGVGAVALNVTVTEPSRSGYVTAYPTGVTPPTASNLNFTIGSTTPNMVIVELGAGGQVSLLNGSAGTVHLVVDVLGWFPTGSAFTGLTPSRLLDTRTSQSTIDGRFNGNGAVAGATTFNVVVSGRGGVPASNVGAVALNVTATNPSADGFLTIYPAGSNRPTASNLNLAPGQTSPNMVIVPIGTAGQISIFNSNGTTDVIVDVLGWFPNPTTPPTTYGNRLTLSSTGIGTATFAISSPSATVALLQPVLGAPDVDNLESFPTYNSGPGDPYYSNSDDYFARPFARVVCYHYSGCLTFGGYAANSLTFVGWSYSDTAAALFDVNGISIGTRVSDFDSSVSYSDGGCYSYSTGSTTSGVQLDLFSHGVPFMSTDAAGNLTFQKPPAGDVYVSGMSAGSLIYSLNSDC